jgi:hypothetical protein
VLLGTRLISKPACSEDLLGTNYRRLIGKDKLYVARILWTSFPELVWKHRAVAASRQARCAPRPPTFNVQVQTIFTHIPALMDFDQAEAHFRKAKSLHVELPVGESLVSLYQPGDVISEFDGKTVPDAKAFEEFPFTGTPAQTVSGWATFTLRATAFGGVRN